MDQTKYKITFAGEVVPGQNIEQVRQKIAALFKISLAKCGQMFDGRSRTIKSGLDQQAAGKYKKAFEQAGAICHIVPINDERPSETSRSQNDDASNAQLSIKKQPLGQERKEELFTMFKEIYVKPLLSHYQFEIDEHMKSVNEMDQILQEHNHKLEEVNLDYETNKSILESSFSSADLQEAAIEDSIAVSHEMQTLLTTRQEYVNKRESQFKQLVFDLNQNVENALSYQDSLSRLVYLHLIQYRVNKYEVTPNWLSEIQDKEYTKKTIDTIRDEYLNAYQSITDDVFRDIEELENRRKDTLSLTSQWRKVHGEIEKIQGDIQKLSERLRGIWDSVLKRESDLKQLNSKLEWIQNPRKRLKYVTIAWGIGGVTFVGKLLMPNTNLGGVMTIISVCCLFIGLGVLISYFVINSRNKTASGQADTLSNFWC